MTNHEAVPGATPRDESQLAEPGFPDPAHPAPEASSLPAVRPEDTSIDAAETPAKKKPRKGKRTATPDDKVKSSLAGSTWVALIAGLLLLILLIVFILQNQHQIALNLFAWSFQFPAGIGYLITAIAGGLIVAMVGMVRMIELRRQVKKARRQAH
ncbi:LapA family protein [Corynebacterium sp. A21]|uniref:LapA family protein n=1 Tax=Corynebacterium sp. A21 TaxID=3457318 RepID=UPI003FD11743